MEKTYKIIRFFKAPSRRPKTLFKGVSLQVAQLHCNDPRTKKDGVYFDGYREE